MPEGTSLAALKFLVGQEPNSPKIRHSLSPLTISGFSPFSHAIYAFCDCALPFTLTGANSRGDDDESALRLHGQFVQEPDGGILGEGNCTTKRH